MSDSADNIECINTMIKKIEVELTAVKKALDGVNQMRVQLAFIQSDLMTTIDSRSWENITEFIGQARYKGIGGEQNED